MVNGNIQKISPYVLRLQGHINESTNYRLFHECYGSGPLLLQMPGLLTINSVGLREILLLVAESPAVIYQGCPPVFLDQINLVPRLLGPSFRLEHLQSVLLDFQCTAESCTLFNRPTRREIYPNGQRPKFAALTCEQCQCALSPIQQHQGLLYCFTPEFRELLEEFRAKDQASKQMAGLRHDFRHRLIALEKMLPATSGPMVDDLRIQLKNFHQMLDELKFNRKFNGSSTTNLGTPPGIASLTLDKLLDDLYPELQLRAKELGKQLIWPKFFGQDLEFAILRPGLWKRLLLNLLQNSLTHCQQSTEMKFLLAKPSNIYCELVIQDDGKELPQEFQVLIQSNTTQPLQMEANSLGLAICNQLCDELGGHFSYTRVRENNYFKVLLPAGHYDANEISSQGKAAEVVHTTSVPYLLACQDKNLQETLQNHLRVKKVPFRVMDPQLWLMIDLTGLKSIYTDHWALAGKAMEWGIETLFANRTDSLASRNQELQRVLNAWGLQTEVDKQS